MTRILALLLAFAALVSLPFWIGNTFYINIAAQVLIYAVLAMGLNVLVGYAGMVTLGHAALFGVACYAAATLINAGDGSIVVDDRCTGRHGHRHCGFRRAGTARHRPRLRHDHRGAGPDRLGHRLPLDQPDQR